MFLIFESQLKNLFTCRNCVNIMKPEPFYKCYKTAFEKLSKNYSSLSSSLNCNYIINSSRLCYKINFVQRTVHTTIKGKLIKNIHNFRNINHHYSRRIFISSTQYGSFDQMIPKSSEEAQEQLSKTIKSHPDAKLLKVAVIGVPNCGKSTLINEIIGWKVCSVSRKVHTTQCSARAVFNYGLTQLVFVDTPGIVTPEESKKYKLKTSLVMDPEKALEQSDLIIVMHDVSNSYFHKTLHPRVLRILYLYPTIPSVLVLNKVDLIKKKLVLLDITRDLTEGIVSDSPIEVTDLNDTNDQELEDRLINAAVNERVLKSSDNTIDISSNKIEVVSENSKTLITEFEGGEETPRQLSVEDVMNGKIKATEKEVQELIKGKRGWPKFREVFMISALEGEGVEELQNYLLRSAKNAPWMFNDDVVTDQSPQEIVLMTVREKCLEYLNHNVPYELKFKLCYWDLSDSELLSILVAVYCKKKNQMKLLIGPGGKFAKRIALEAEQDLRNIFRTEIKLRINFEHNPSVVGADL